MNRFKSYESRYNTRESIRKKANYTLNSFGEETYTCSIRLNLDDYLIVSENAFADSISFNQKINQIIKKWIKDNNLQIEFEENKSERDLKPNENLKENSIDYVHLRVPKPVFEMYQTAVMASE